MPRLQRRKKTKEPMSHQLREQTCHPVINCVIDTGCAGYGPAAEQSALYMKLFKVTSTPFGPQSEKCTLHKQLMLNKLAMILHDLTNSG